MVDDIRDWLLKAERLPRETIGVERLTIHLWSGITEDAS